MSNKQYVCRICRPLEYFCELRQLHLHLFVIHSLFPIDEKLMPLFDNIIEPVTAKVDSNVNIPVSSESIEPKPSPQRNTIPADVLNAAIAEGIERGVSKAIGHNTNRSARSLPARSPAFQWRRGKPNHARMGRGSQPNRNSGSDRSVTPKGGLKTESKDGVGDFPSYSEMRLDVIKSKFPNRKD